MDERQQFGRRHRMRVISGGFQLALGGGIAHRRAQILAQLLHDGVRRADRRHQRKPAAGIEAGQRFRGGGQIGKVGQPLRRADGERLDRA